MDYLTWQIDKSAPRISLKDAGKTSVLKIIKHYFNLSGEKA